MDRSVVATRISAIVLGAGLLSGVYVLMTPRVIPDLTTWPDGASGPQLAALRWLVGLVLGAITMTVWYLLRGAIRRARATP